MPSSSIIWIALVAVWLFVLVPMLVSKRPRIRQTTDAALATRVLHRGDAERPARGPAAGHRSDPNWRPASVRLRGDTYGDDSYGTDAEDRMDAHADESMMDDAIDRTRGTARDYVPNRRGRGGFDPEADAIASAARYQFRQRTVLGLIFATILTAALAVALTPVMWWVSAFSVVALVGYLAYLRRQVHLEQEIRGRRMARLGRSRLGVESDSDEELRLVPARLRRPGAVVLEVDDGDPAFDHLDHYDAEFVERGDRGRHDDYEVSYRDDGMRRASGQ
ncbi:gephyrin-like molybdotransferase receptor GlpR [Rhodococcus sp. TAF43]|uniref:divisome protein SepX/GlpR n=1 Tax=Rhodococcus sp. TAF43 TaxID=3237483 RepID=UPI003F9CCC7F